MRRLFLVTLVLLLAGLACDFSLPAGLGGTADTSQALKSLDSGLDQLRSYRLSLNLRFTGRPAGDTTGGQEQTVIVDASEEFAPLGSQAARHFFFIANLTGADPAALPDLPGALEYYELGGQIYTLSSNQSRDPLCRPVQQTGNGTGGGFFTSGSIFDLLPQIAAQAIAGAQPVPVPEGQPGEAINGVPVDHYRLDPTTTADGQNQVEGDLWVSKSGGYVVRFTGALQGPVAIDVLNGSGVLGWEYNLSDANTLAEIAVPEQCLALSQASGLLPTNANDVRQSSAGLSFTSPSAPPELLQFYQARLPEQGWTIDQEGGSGTEFNLSASRTQNTGSTRRFISITISAGAGLSQVTIETYTSP